MQTNSSEAQLPSPDRRQRRSRRAIGASVAVGLLAAATGGYAAIDSLRSGHTNRPAATATPNQPKASPSETSGRFERFVPLTVPAEVAQKLSNEAVFIMPYSCSGGRIRNQSGQVIGASFIKHCLGADLQQMSTDSKGQSHMNAQIKVLDGSNKRSLDGFANAVIVGNGLDGDGVAKLVLEGHTADEVNAAYEASRRPVDTVQSGDTIYFAASPAAHDDQIGPPEQQFFAVSVLGFLPTNDGTPGLLVTASSEPCSQGSSGAQSYKDDGNGQLVSLDATLQDFWDIKTPNVSPQDNQAILAHFNPSNIDISAARGLCIFATGGQLNSSAIPVG